MPRTRTRDQLVQRARELADMETNGFISDTEAEEMVAQSVAELWGILVTTDPDRYSVTSDISATAGTYEYAVPADFMQCLMVERLIGSGPDGITLEPYSLQEQNQIGLADLGGSFVTSVRYLVTGQGADGSGTVVRFRPDPGSATYRLHYVQAPQDLAAGASEFDGVAGWEEFVTHDAAIQMKQKEESDTSVLERRLARIETRIKRLSGLRKSGQPRLPARIRNRVHHRRATSA